MISTLKFALLTEKTGKIYTVKMMQKYILKFILTWRILGNMTNWPPGVYFRPRKNWVIRRNIIVAFPNPFKFPSLSNIHSSY